MQKISTLLLVSVTLSTLSVLGVLRIWQEEFHEGATLSGLNPGGGGPGFFILILPAIFGFLAGRSACNGVDSDRLRLGLTFALFGGLLTAGLLHLGIFWVLPADFPNPFALTSTAGLAFAIPIIVHRLVDELPEDDQDSEGTFGRDDGANPDGRGSRRLRD